MTENRFMKDGKFASGLIIKRITLKDLSFEMPIGQAAFAVEWQPAVEISLDHSRNLLPDGNWEVVIRATVSSKLG